MWKRHSKLPYIRPSKKLNSFSSGLFFLKEEGGPYYLLFMNFMLFVSKMATVVDLKRSYSFIDAIWNTPVMHITIKPAISFAK